MSNHFTGLSLGPPLGDQRLDLCDLYAFQSPVDQNRTVIILNANPNADALHPDAIYRLKRHAARTVCDAGPVFANKAGIARRIECRDRQRRSQHLDEPAYPSGPPNVGRSPCVVRFALSCGQPMSSLNTRRSRMAPIGISLPGIRRYDVSALRSVCASAISGNSGVGVKPSSADASTAWASTGRSVE
jgi:hypothetical protein